VEARAAGAARGGDPTGLSDDGTGPVSVTRDHRILGVRLAEDQARARFARVPVARRGRLMLGGGRRSLGTAAGAKGLGLYQATSVGSFGRWAARTRVRSVAWFLSYFRRIDL
jgi:hypothetical protein